MKNRAPSSRELDRKAGHRALGDVRARTRVTSWWKKRPPALGPGLGGRGYDSKTWASTRSAGQEGPARAPVRARRTPNMHVAALTS